MLRGLVREHFRGDVGIGYDRDHGTLDVKELRAALTTFPRAREVTLVDLHEEFGEGEKEALLQWLREGGRGRHLRGMMVENEDSSTLFELVHEALQAGALPSLRRVDASLQHELPRVSLTGGFLGGMHELHLTLDCSEELEPQLTALGLVRQLPALAKLELKVEHEDEDPVEWPSFIPPCLRALSINVRENDDPSQSDSSLLAALPGILGASGARLECLEVLIAPKVEDIGERLVHVAQALRCCSPTLKGFLLSTEPQTLEVDEELDGEDYADQVERLRMQWADVLASVSACHELQVLVLPSIEVKPLFPPGTAFGRLTDLQMSDYKSQDPPDAGVMGLWELMASGGLPALAKLSVMLMGQYGDVEEVKSRMAPALEAVAGTLTRLHLQKGSYVIADEELCGDEEGVGYELGVAVGKLGRLKDLALGLFRDGWAYYAVALGLAASGGYPPLPLLWRVWVVPRVTTNVDLLASLLLPGVRVFGSAHNGAREAILTACALRQTGHKHSVAVWCHPTLHGAECSILRSIAPGCRIAMENSWEYESHPYTILPVGRAQSLSVTDDASS
jgi:hypothetical protein